MVDFTPWTIIRDILNVIDENKDKDAYNRLKKLITRVGYTAPEVRDIKFWGHPEKKIFLQTV